MSRNIRIIFIILSVIFAVFALRIVQFYTNVNNVPMKDEPETPTVNQINEKYYSFRDNGLYGVKDRNGKIVIEASWSSIEKIGNECFQVSKYTSAGQRFGIIDSMENIIVPFIYTGIENMDDEFLIGKTDDEKYVIFDYFGNVLINEEWDRVFKNYPGKTIETSGNYIQAEKNNDFYRIVSDENGKFRISDIQIEKKILGEKRTIRVQNTCCFAGLGETCRIYNEMTDISIRFAEALFSGDSAAVKELAWSDDYRELMLENLNLGGSELTFMENPAPSVKEKDGGTLSFRSVFSVEYTSPSDIQWDGTYTSSSSSLEIEINMKKRQDGKLAVSKVYTGKSGDIG